MSDPFISEIRAFGFSFAPRNWAFCNGALIDIQSNSALFALLGTTYGGDGRVQFQLPDLRGRAAISFGQGAGLSNYRQGQHLGTQTVTLTTNQMPKHNHNVQAASDRTANMPDNNVLGARPVYSDTDPDTTLHPGSVGNTGTGTAYDNYQPYQVLNFCIATAGVFPQQS